MQKIFVSCDCYHCGQPCEEDFVVSGKHFCCYGCKTVFEILNDNDLCSYYSMDASPGNNLRYVDKDSFDFLDEKTVAKKLLDFDSQDFASIQFYIPSVHCISCIWLLENLSRLDSAIVKSELNFGRKVLKINFNPQKSSLSKIARLLSSLGYPPKVNLQNEKTEATHTNGVQLLIQLAVAGFCFGNVMLFSFPEYLGMGNSDSVLKGIFSYLNFALAIPVIFYCGKDYFINAWSSFRQHQINIDFPIALGLTALFLRSSYEIFFHLGPGYMDSFTGLVFFLLIGRWFQSKTYESLVFDRDYKSYFPMSVQKITEQGWKPVVVSDLKKNDLIMIRNAEIVPADSILVNEQAFIDYSFVTGESKPVKISEGEKVYAGGRLAGPSVEFIVEKETSQSHLTSLWNNDAFKKQKESTYRKIIDKTARRFTWVVLVIAVVTAVVWNFVEPARMWLIVTAVLMVACPCALALAAPFTYGSMLRVLGKNQFYLKNADVIERLGQVDTIVFDKTGTITHGASTVNFIGELEVQELGWIKTLTASSTHPLSQLIHHYIQNTSALPIHHFQEKAGHGIQGDIEGVVIKIGSSSFVGFEGNMNDLSSKVFVSINHHVRGYFKIETAIREQVRSLIQRLKGKTISLISGDHDKDRKRMESVFPKGTALLFDQNPLDKLEYISNLQKKGHHVMMVGDGLNDSGALKQSDVGIAVTDDVGLFTPACDGILAGSRMGQLNLFIDLCKAATSILKAGFVISLCYNFITLSIAVSGHLTPIVAAILMPVSSISVVLFTTTAVNIKARSLMVKFK